MYFSYFFSFVHSIPFQLYITYGCVHSLQVEEGYLTWRAGSGVIQEVEEEGAGGGGGQPSGTVGLRTSGPCCPESQSGKTGRERRAEWMGWKNMEGKRGVEWRRRHGGRNSRIGKGTQTREYKQECTNKGTETGAYKQGHTNKGTETGAYKQGHTNCVGCDALRRWETTYFHASNALPALYPLKLCS